MINFRRYPQRRSTTRWRPILPGLALLWCLVACAPAQQTILPPPSDLSLEALFGNDPAAENSPLLAEARAQLGAPYRLGGAAPDGFDCSGLAQYVYSLAGIKIPRQAEAQYRQAHLVRELHPGDLIFFKDLDDDNISHVAIHASGSLFIHAPRDGRGVCFDSLDSPYWQQRFVGAGRFR